MAQGLVIFKSRVLGTFDPESAYVVKVVAIDVSVHPEQTPHDRFDCITEVLWECDPCWRGKEKKERGQKDRDYRELKHSYLFCWGRRIRRLGCFEPSSSVRPRNLVQRVWWVVCILPRLPKGIRIFT